MEQRTYTVYKFDELPEESKQKAIEKYRENEDLPWMANDMKEVLMGILDKNKIEYDSESLSCTYSLSHSQGDGFQFTGTFAWKGYSILIKHSGHYEHSYCTDIDLIEPDLNDDEGVAQIAEKDDEEFRKLYHAICKQMEDYGYKYIEDQLSDETITDTLIANDYDFKLDGSID